jgi:hypothetical protein
MAYKNPLYYLWSLFFFSCANVMVATIYGWRFHGWRHFLISESIVIPYCVGMYLARLRQRNGTTSPYRVRKNEK